MCGFCGFITTNNNYDNKKIIKEINNFQKHRGPDSEGYYINSDLNLYLAHRRLSVLDLSNNGNQPMFDNSKKKLIIFNGEIYNHLQLRKKYFDNQYWKSQSDTETLLNLIIKIGPENTLKVIDGMFSFAYFDLTKNIFYLARDRFGEKPLYYGWSDNTFLFSSELKPIIYNPHFKKKIEPKTLKLYLNLNYVPAPYSIFRNIFKLDSSTLKKFKINNGIVLEKETSNYWDFIDLKSNLKNQNTYKEFDPIEDIQSALENSVKKQLISDVPIGSFLSGGIDSSLITAIMQKHSNTKVNSFSIGFENDEYDESIHAQKVAKHIGTNHYSEILTPKKSLEIISNLSRIYDEPFADSSQIPSVYLSSITRNKVTVALTGDGGDEIFAGYNRYTIGQLIDKKIMFMPYFFRSTLANIIRTISPKNWNKIFNLFNILIPDHLNFKNKGEKLYKLATIMRSKNSMEAYLFLISNWLWDDKILNLNNYNNEFPFKKNNLDNFNYLDQMMILDAKNYLTDDILVKVDRASMYSSLETRVPFLDKELVELSFKLKSKQLINNNNGKFILRRILNKYIPQEIYERPKQGFGLPIGDWIRGDMHEWASHLISKKSLEKHGLFKDKIILKMFEDHVKGNANYEYKLWNILMFQLWYEEYL